MLQSLWGPLWCCNDRIKLGPWSQARCCIFFHCAGHQEAAPWIYFFYSMYTWITVHSFIYKTTTPSDHIVKQYKFCCRSFHSLCASGVCRSGFYTFWVWFGIYRLCWNSVKVEHLWRVYHTQRADPGSNCERAVSWHWKQALHCIPSNGCTLNKINPVILCFSDYSWNTTSSLVMSQSYCTKSSGVCQPYVVADI